MEVGIVGLHANVDFAVGAPPGAPGEPGTGHAIKELHNKTHGRGERILRNATGEGLPRKPRQ